MLIPESITGISCFMFRPKPSQRLPTLHGRALHGFHFHHHVSPGLIPCNYGKNHAVHGTCHGSAWSLCQTQKKVKSWRVIKSFLYKPGDIERESAPKQRFTEKLAAIWNKHGLYKMHEINQKTWYSFRKHGIYQDVLVFNLANPSQHETWNGYILWNQNS